MTYKTGTLGEFKAWTQQIVTQPQQALTEPRQWYDTDATAIKAGAGGLSAEAMVKLLSPDNLALLQVIGRDHPDSVKALADMTGRKPSNLSRTLKRFEQAGIVRLSPGPGRVRRPLLIAHKVRMEIDLLGTGSTVAVDIATPV
jgi:predicted transcriptional regulator